MIDNFESYLREKYKEYLKYLDLISHIENDAFELKLIEIKHEHKGRGIGSKILNEITDFADQNGLIVVLSVSEIKTNKLIKWYKQFGFLENKNRNKDFRFMSRMIRYPLALTRSKWIDKFLNVEAEVIEFTEKGDYSVVLYDTNGGDCVYVDVYKGDEGIESWHFTPRQLDEASNKYAELCEKVESSTDIPKYLAIRIIDGNAYIMKAEKINNRWHVGGDVFRGGEVSIVDTKTSKSYTLQGSRLVFSDYLSEEQLKSWIQMYQEQNSS